MSVHEPLRLLAALAVFVSLFALVGWRLHGLQVADSDRLASLAQRQRSQVHVLPAPRGSIVDATGAPLAVAAATWTVVADPGYMDDKLRATVELARICGLKREDLRAEFERENSNGRTLARNLDEQQAAAVRALKLTGLRVVREVGRDYPSPGLAAHVLGFVLADGRGGAGLEQEFNDALTGTPGREVVELDARGRAVLTGALDSAEAVPGASMQLTLEIAVQQELEAAIDACAEKFGPAGIAGLVVRPGTGELVAMASWPRFDPGDRRGMRPEQGKNLAVSLVYEPGSTFKPLVAGAAVADRLARWDESIFCEHGRWTCRIGRSARTITDHSVGHGGHANLTIVQGIALSDNILMAKLGLRLGPERLHSWAESFGFGRRTGVPLPGEEVGIMAPRSKWTQLGACMSVPMGHEISVTPLQLAMAHAAVANDGLWLPPRLVRRMYRRGADGREADVPLPAQPEARRMFAAADALRIQEAMTHTMTEGTARNADLDGYTAAGKTGTAEKVIDGRYARNRNVGSFVCWAPADPGCDPRRKLLCLVVVDDPTRNGRFGSEVAAPAVQRVLQFALENQREPKRPAPDRPARRGR